MNGADRWPSFRLFTIKIEFVKREKSIFKIKNYLTISNCKINGTGLYKSRSTLGESEMISGWIICRNRLKIYWKYKSMCFGPFYRITFLYNYYWLFQLYSMNNRKYVNKKGFISARVSVTFKLCTHKCPCPPVLNKIFGSR